MTAAARIPAPRHLPGGGARGVRQQRVRVPWRIVANPYYADVALTVYVKISALTARPEGCEAAVPTLASYLGISSSSVERGITQLHNPAPDGVVEVISRRRTHRGGRGHTAHRTVRQPGPDERFVWLPVAAAEVLTPRQMRAYAVLAYADARSLPITAAELAGYLRHQSGARAGQPVDERSARRILLGLETARWVTVHVRAGERGRHLVDVHHRPVHPVPDTAPADTDEGSGPDDHGGSLASKEDHRTDSPEERAAGLPSAVGDLPPVARGPVDNPVAGPAPAPPPSPAGPAVPRPAPPQPTPPPSRPPAYTAPVWAALAPVRDLLPDLTAWETRCLQHAVAGELARCDGDLAARVHRIEDRLFTRRLGRPDDTIRSPGRWLLGAAVPRWGCPQPDCESGRRWSTGARCNTCAHLDHAHTPPGPGSSPPRRAYRGPAPPGPDWSHECDQCGAVARTPLPAGLCRPCHTATA
ncbi:hypothetical protein [Streptomyces sp. WMMC897]|uniref:hypothetical protein n=1 Tax=Streptomyces sp. WMMC897 TaxID=3014782 RepID=UPI0022B6C750|nr:hypothetical protein [Streptomyces sp. WMMC897]MCZ7414287.1 hypothetical protein [Streptomyces sp. WMMC897]